ncbi:MAG: phage integrase N-terminal SAM-like domain-containing protein [Vicinamibacterales bacterium]
MTEPVPPSVRPESPRLLDRVRALLRARHYSANTESAYVAWIRRFIYYHQKRHPNDVGVEGVNAFLTHVVLTRREVALVLSGIDGACWLAAAIMYGGGLRLLEC